ncbi:MULTISPECIES: hypothetical protein [unclassified Streptomyces]|uniref:hypothetical protein n=1 Tax=unclassified Streptomyces TaxID=2593676 RepID=UPI002E116D25|nr:hypothetical protein OG452_32730 [Streptomyces sp. NBC_01197]WSS47532.1 hypothetical protein OG708_02115 [Streptomyces sp. NBC_01180]
MSSGAARGPATARLAVVCAVLFGLFLMHGAPATAAGGCHGFLSSASMNAAMPGGTDAARPGGANAAMPPGHGGSAMAPAAAHPVAAHQGPAFRAGTGAGPRGAVCVSTPARDRTLFGPGLSGPAVLALPAVRPSRGRAVLLGGTGRRGPPVSGRSLLLRVCVARA